MALKTIMTTTGEHQAVVFVTADVERDETGMVYVDLISVLFDSPKGINIIDAMSYDQLERLEEEMVAAE